jgi:HAD superfamily hydrolase (TIGR01484 family)
MQPLSKLSQKSLIVFDLDGTLTESKAPLKPDMARALTALLAQKKAVIIGGGSYEQFKNQFIERFTCPPTVFKNLFLFPTTSTSFYRYQRGGWRQIYRKVLTPAEKKKIMRAFADAFAATKYVPPKKLWGKAIEDRGSQITFSALGQKAPVKAKAAWNKKSDVRPALMKIIKKELLKFEVRRGGLTSIDVTQKGIDKAYGVRQIEKILKIPIKDILFIGDALYPGGNDAAAKKTGVQTMAVRGPKDTIEIIKKILKAR